MSAILTLYRLQQVDSQLDHATQRLHSIQQTLENDTELKAARQRLDEAEANLRAAERALRQAEADVAAQKIKIEQAESSLYSGRVQNPKELQDLQHDVASLKRHLATLEDRELEAMIALEDCQKAHTGAQSVHGTVQSRVMAQNNTLGVERENLLNQTDRLRTERQAVFSALDPANADLYEQLRRKRHGVAVTTVSEGACDSCGAPLPPGLHQQAKTLLTACPGCGRILYNSR